MKMILVSICRFLFIKGHVKYLFLFCIWIFTNGCNSKSQNGIEENSQPSLDKSNIGNKVGISNDTTPFVEYKNASEPIGGFEDFIRTKLDKLFKDKAGEFSIDCYREYLENSHTPSICVEAITFYQIMKNTDAELSDSILVDFTDKFRNHVLINCNLDIRELDFSDMVYFPSDSLIYKKVAGLNTIGYSPALFYNTFWLKEDTIHIDEEHASYLIQSPHIESCYTNWDMKIEHVIDHIFQLQVGVEEKRYNEFYLFFDSKSGMYLEGTGWLANYFDIKHIEEQVLQDERIQISEELNRLGAALADTSYQDEFAISTMNQAILDLEREKDHTGLHLHDYSRYYFTDSTLVVFNQYGPSNGFYDFYTQIEMPISKIRIKLE